MTTDWCSIAHCLAAALERLDALYRSEQDADAPLHRPQWLSEALERYRGATSTTLAAAHGSANTPLRADVKDGKLIVEIGIETLEWASRKENGGPLDGCKVDGRKRREWANDVVREMTREDEIGGSPLGKFLDSMMEAAANNGSAALCWPNAQRERPAGKMRPPFPKRTKWL